MSQSAPAADPLWKQFLLGRAHADDDTPETTHPWNKVLWLTGVDYFSTLGYQPGIAFLACGALSPVATALLVLVTIFGALPTYREVAARSYLGQGSIAMLEHLLPGWWAKLLVLVLLGFASTDFVITITLSAADAAAHAVENPLLHGLLGDHRLPVTLALLVGLGVVFLMGFREALGMAMVVGVPYIALSGLVILRGLFELLTRDGVWSQWLHSPALAAPGPSLVLASILAFPKLALGMSGFETGVSVMQLIEGEPLGGSEVPKRRIASTQKLLATAALMMSALLVTSALVTAVLIPPDEFLPGGKANGRALAFLAHTYLGHGLGTLYDFVTMAILWFAGASAMTGLLTLVPRYLPRFGMAPHWVEFPRPLILMLMAVCVGVTLVFKADVDAQAGAYATGVLVLMLSAAVAVCLAFLHEVMPLHPRVLLRPEGRRALYFAVVALVFAFTLADNVLERPDGVIISTIFIMAILTFSGLSRWWRATELRVERLEFADENSARLWPVMRGKKVNLVPLEHAAPKGQRKKLYEVRTHYKTEGPLAFLHVSLRDDRSEFTTPLRVRVEEMEGGNFKIEVTGAVAISNAIAYISEELDPIAIFFTLTGRNPMIQAFNYLLWGEGETGVQVYEILVQHWARTPEDDVRPQIFLMSPE